ncbi:MAG: alpha/beta fold hydrolase [Schaalia odontolytica]
MKTLLPASAIELEGPWTHRHVSAGGTAFHVADMGESMDHALVLLHGFPEHWWSWREALPMLAEQTPRVFALDIRGFGTSDLTHGDYDLRQMANDVIGVVRALGVASFSVAGTGIGGTIAWMIGALAPLELRSVCVLSAPHPLGVQPVIGRAPWAGGRVLQGRLALPTGRERALRSGSLVTTVYRAWASPGNVDGLVSQSGPYRAALQRPFAANTALRGLSAAHKISREERRLLAEPLSVPVLSLVGRDDGAWSPLDHAADAQFVDAPLTQIVIREAGHFLPEEAPQAVAQALSEHVAAHTIERLFH